MSLANMGAGAQKVGRVLVDPEHVKKNERKIKYIAVHCAATSPSMVVDIERIRKWHLKRGFNDVGYHFYVRRDGSVEYGRPIFVSGAHVANYNSKSIGICYEGGIDEKGNAEDNRTEAQKNTLEKLLKELKGYYSKAVIQGHRDFPNVYKSCPCFDAKEEYKNI